MRAHQVFAAMSPEQASRVLTALREKAPGVYTQGVAAASGAFKARPQFLMKQPAEKRDQMVRRALSRVSTAPLAEEILAAYFLEVKKELLAEWLDGLGIEHEEGALHADPPEPDEAALRSAVEAFRAAGEAGDREDRELLLRAFAAQQAVDWPRLDALLAE